MNAEQKQQLILRLKAAKDEALLRRVRDKQAKQLARKLLCKTTKDSDQNNNVQSHMNVSEPPLKQQKRHTDLTRKRSHESLKKSKSAANSSQNKNVQNQLNLNKPSLKRHKRQTDLTSKHSHESVVHNKSKPARKEKWKEYSRRYRAKKRENPLTAQEQKEKEHARYLRRKEAKNIKLIGDMTAREQRIMRRKWRENTQNSRNRRRMAQNADLYVEENSPPETPANGTDSTAWNSQSGDTDKRNQGRQKAGRKRVRRDRASAYVQLKKSQRDLIEANRRAEKWKKRCQRIEATFRPKNVSPSPKTTVTKILKGCRVTAAVRKRLEYNECIQKQLKHNAKEAATQSEKQALARSLSGHIIRKYKMQSKCRPLVSWWHAKHFSQSQSRIRAARNSALSAVQRKQVRSFLEQDANSRMCAGKREYVVKQGQKEQKRYLCDTLLNLHRKFCLQHTNVMSYATFCRLRPFWIVEPKAKDRETCGCVRHDNMRFLTSKLSMLGLIGPKTPRDLCETLVCYTGSKSCMYGECLDCQDRSIVKLQPTDTNNETFFYRWNTKSVNRVRAKDGAPIVVKVTAKEKVACTTDEMFSFLVKELPGFKEHEYRMNHQENIRTEMKASLLSNEGIMVIDFSENYSCKYSAETQSVHFGASRQQVTMHTGVLYFMSGDGALGCRSFCSVSESLRHDASAIWAHLKPIFNVLTTSFPQIDTLHIWSDGPTMQYRNRRNFAIFSVLHNFGNFKIATWNYSESGHGKAAADGIGGSLKRTADRLVAHGFDITDASVLFSALQTSSSETELYMITDSDIKAVDSQYDSSAVKCIKGTMKLHQLTWTKTRPKFFGMRYLSCLECPAEAICKHYSVGEMLLSMNVKFTGELVPQPAAHTRAVEKAVEMPPELVTLPSGPETCQEPPDMSPSLVTPPADHETCKEPAEMPIQDISACILDYSVILHFVHIIFTSAYVCVCEGVCVCVCVYRESCRWILVKFCGNVFLAKAN